MKRVEFVKIKWAYIVVDLETDLAPEALENSVLKLHDKPSAV